MSIVFDGATDSAEHTAVPSGSWTIAGWIRVDANSGHASDGVFGFGAAGFTNATVLGYRESEGAFKIFHANAWDGPPDDLVAQTTGTFQWFFIKWDESAGEITIGYLDDGDIAIQDTIVWSGASAATWTDLLIGCMRNDSTDESIEATFYNTLVWDSVITDANLLTQRLYNNSQFGTPWAHYKYATGALDIDASGNSRTLTINGNPTFSADAPTAILGDDPAGEEESVADGILLGDSVTVLAMGVRQVTDGLSLGDAVANVAHGNRSATDGLALGESVSAVGHFVRSASDGITLGEDIDTTLTIDTGPDGILLGDSAVGVTEGAREVTDGITLGDSGTSLLHAVEALTDGLLLGDAAAALLEAARSVADGIRLGDGVVFTGAFPRSLADGILLGDVADNGNNFVRVASGGIVLGDSVLAGPGFLPIPKYTFGPITMHRILGPQD
jgi:hypothetical protein